MTLRISEWPHDRNLLNMYTTVCIINSGYTSTESIRSINPFTVLRYKIHVSSYLVKTLPLNSHFVTPKKHPRPWFCCSLIFIQAEPSVHAKPDLPDCRAVLEGGRAVIMAVYKKKNYCLRSRQTACGCLRSRPTACRIARTGPPHTSNNV